ncbi:RNA polymerase sigma-70 factor [Pedobacter hiemivivus]|uniref:RNA polymerase sigma-70 factor n=1 Tax=Pedobacter hiemivivus TaxID=2530454 RepID=A0A4U1GMJ2_9SPHI|nr:RNA polymerase sigma-70 factor [Pedobacter hiemivivus]TKC65657.1 RNA polymerase sigma-70 factor [Pedobacter hiemivivus]
MELYGKLSDPDLITLIKAGDDAAFTEIYNRYWGILYSHARRMLHNDEEAEDIIQEIFVSFLKKVNVLELKNNLSGYLYQSVRNMIYNFIERDKNKEKYMESLEQFIEQGEYQADYLIREKQFRGLIENEIASLPESMRKIFELSRNSHLSYLEIADQLGVTEGVVRNNISRALKILKSKLGATVLFYLFINSL